MFRIGALRPFAENKAAVVNDAAHYGIGTRRTIFWIVILLMQATGPFIAYRLSARSGRASFWVRSERDLADSEVPHASDMHWTFRFIH